MKVKQFLENYLNKIIILLFFIFPIYCIGQCLKPDTTIFSDRSRNGYFIVLNSKDNNSFAVIRNSELMIPFIMFRNSTEDYYISYMTNLSLNCKLYYELFEDLKIDPNCIISPINNIDSVSNYGKEYFINNYLPKGIFNEKLDDTEKLYIIKILYEWGINVKSDCESGVLFAPSLLTPAD